ncbi:uncharacterized protein LOC120122161 [Hibiscus syriacus]|uniref:uncharacterized protein LOC120122161 n=1 Tax=Hibiscus syriacus TaxID=106335 RepID=UPI0019208016|nr:uncharacterized protein LOC120122161 [Hibiscus syriacus]
MVDFQNQNSDADIEMYATFIERFAVRVVFNMNFNDDDVDEVPTNTTMVVVMVPVLQLRMNRKRLISIHESRDDDVMTVNAFLDADECVKCVLEKFYELSGLRLNVSKTEIFIASMLASQMSLVHEATGFKIGGLHVRYLGVPFVFRKLTKKDSASLVEKIKAKLQLWSNRWLSYAGKLQLVKDVLFRWTNFVLDFSERVEMCQKRELECAGGNLLVTEGSLWVAWVRTYVFKGIDLWHSLIAWMAILDRFPTADKLLRMRIEVDV